MQLGGYGVLPCALGGGKTRLQFIHESLNQQRGTAYDVSGPSSPVWVENMATARAVDTIYSTNDRLALIADPRVTSVAARWEAIFGIVPAIGATLADRRAALVEAWSRLGTFPARQTIVDKLSAALGPVFVAYRNIDPLQVVSFVNPWRSTFAHVLVQVQQPASYTAGQWQTSIAKIGPILDWALPAWTTWDFYIDGSGHVGGGLVGDGGAGFFLDEADLDREILDV